MSLSIPYPCTVQYTTIPLPSKLFKLLVKDLENALEATQAAGNHGNDDDGSDASSEVTILVMGNMRSL